jgi:8-oxo-dGTP pyrophosphatase MutT (NUDIX family)
MYEVFLNDRKITITRPGKIPFVKEAVITKNLASVDEVKNWFLNFSITQKESAIIIQSSPEMFWINMFIPAFKLIPAAGGVVFRNNKLLFILRNGKWDLPKGKIDKSETSEQAAIREVAEECGIIGHTIVKRLSSSYHIFQSPYKDTFGQWILKETFWFEMKYKGKENGSPQTDENISEIMWFEKNELDRVLQNTHENLKPIILRYKE